MKLTTLTLMIGAGLAGSLPLSGQTRTSDLSISHLAGDYYVYTTYRSYDGGPVPSNSMYLVTDRGAVLFDTPWDTAQFQPLLDSIQARHHVNVVLCIATHFHADRTAGLSFLRERGVKTYSSRETFDLCREHGEKQAEYTFTQDTTFIVGNHRIQTYYPGEGHTKDNIVIWSGDEKILYGGCLVKSTEINDLGNIADANIAQWPATIRNVMRRFPGARFVVPGHFGWADNHGLEHTLSLLKKSNRNGNH